MQVNPMTRANMMETAVVSEDYCLHKHVHLTVSRRAVSITGCHFEVRDDNGDFMFEVKEKLLTLHDRRVLLNAGGTPVATLRRKNLSARKRWQVFRGESSDSANLLFSVRKNSFVQFNRELDVFLSENGDETSWDFKVVGSWLERSCTIYSKGWKHIAKMQKRCTLGNIVFGKKMFDVTVYPKVDCAFVIALFVIMYEMNKEDDD